MDHICPSAEIVLCSLESEIGYSEKLPSLVFSEMSAWPKTALYDPFKLAR